jgi:hypothetical protein
MEKVPPTTTAVPRVGSGPFCEPLLFVSSNNVTVAPVSPNPFDSQFGCLVGDVVAGVAAAIIESGQIKAGWRPGRERIFDAGVSRTDRSVARDVEG